MTVAALKIGEPQSPLKDFGRVLALQFAVLGSLVAILSVPGLAHDYFVRQDAVVVGLYAAAFGALGLRLWPRWSLGALPRIGPRTVAAGAGLGVLLLWAGTHWLMFDYPLTRDEHMVAFDAAIFGTGEPAARLAPEWRAFFMALVPAFALEIASNAAWVSAYMPVNAALRAGFGMLLDPALMNPLLAGIGAIALFRIARRIFPDGSAAPLVALLLYATSAQVLVTAMTVYAMTGHLALNLVWLALFLRGGRLGHGGAIAIGFLATGLHQIVFHPLFVLPFLEHLRRRGEWRPLGAYLVGYALIGLFWISYHGIVSDWLGLASQSGAAAGPAAFFRDRVLSLLLDPNPAGLQLMIYNLLRLFTWQNLAVLPLLLAALPAVRASDGIARPLFLGLLITTLAMFILLPDQGHGWGYRYLHGLLGSLALLGGYGWERLQTSGREAGAFVAGATALTVLVCLPLQLWSASSYVRPYAAVDRMIAEIDADFVVVDTGRVRFAIDQVRNDPYLRNRPLRFASSRLDLAQVTELCRRGSVVFVGRERMQALGLGTAHRGKSRPFERLARDAGTRGCGRRA